ncbi:hypothetical protein ACJZ2D_004584 [Fusarium nematophilum]
MALPIWSIPGLNKPKVPGCDFADVVIAAGDGTALKADDYVFGFSPPLLSSGTLAEVVHLEARGASIVLKKPPGWDHVHIAGLPLAWLTAWTLIQHCEAHTAPGKGKLVFLGGSSSVGMLVVRVAKQRDWAVLASCSSRNRDFVLKMGASEVVDYTRDSVPQAVSEFYPDAIVDCVGGTECLGLANQCYVTTVGDKTSRASLGGSLLYFTNPRMLLRWAWGWMGLGTRYDCINLEPRADYLEEGMKMEQDMVKVDGVFNFNDVKAAFERLNSAKTRGKVIVKLPSEDVGSTTGTV